MLIPRVISLICILILSSCKQEEKKSAETTWQEFCCRDAGDPTARTPLYRAITPINWQRKNPSVTESIADSTKPVSEFYIGQHDQEKVSLTVFTFPVENYEQRVPPSAQLKRWKRQFEEFNPTSLVVTPCAHGGFTGFSICVKGLMNGQETSLLGFSMQLAPVHWFSLQQNKENISLKHSQTTADYTIKALGTPSAILKWKDEIYLFANSFELIEEIPVR
ncbi:MAG: hypothetical protein H0W50_07235 [Parachlamydiaceae bacterium]|nr:hypothetical protein [Parachlamydiaceae bacterium]